MLYRSLQSVRESAGDFKLNEAVHSLYHRSKDQVEKGWFSRQGIDEGAGKKDKALSFTLAQSLVLLNMPEQNFHHVESPQLALSRLTGLPMARVKGILKVLSNQFSDEDAEPFPVQALISLH